MNACDKESTTKKDHYNSCLSGLKSVPICAWEGRSTIITHNQVILAGHFGQNLNIKNHLNYNLNCFLPVFTKVIRFAVAAKLT